MFAAIAGARLPEGDTDLGAGVKLRRVYAHVFSATMAAFKRAEPGKAHPAPWKAIRGGVAFDVEGELVIPDDYRVAGLDAEGSVWWLIAGLRVAGNTMLTVPAVAEVSFGAMATASGEPVLHSAEMERRQLIPGRLDCDVSGLRWVSRYWHSAGRLAEENERFLLLVRAVDEALFAPTTGLGTVLIWGALEGLFLRERQELAFRIASAVAAYLEPPGPGRLAKYKTARKLYDARSRAAHGSSKHDAEAFMQTWVLANTIVSRIAETGRVPSPDDVLTLLLQGSSPPETDLPPPQSCDPRTGS